MKKAQQLGMNPSTASGRLVKDLLFKFIIDAGNKCHRCGGELTRETFSIEHIENWLDSDDPIKLYFDLSNIAFSHKSCNFSAARKKETPHGTLWRYQKYRCRCDECKKVKKEDIYKWREKRLRKS